MSRREPQLRRAVHALTDDANVTRTVVGRALVAAAGTGARDADLLDDTARRAAAAALPVSPGAGEEPLVWDYLSSLDPLSRLDAVDALLRGPADPSGIVADLAALLSVDPGEARARAQATLARRADAAPEATTTYDDALAAARGRRLRRRGLTGLAAALVTVVSVPVLALTGGGLPGPADLDEGPAPARTPAVREQPGFRQAFPPPWVLLPEVRRQRIAGTTRVQLETNCANPADEDFRSLTVIRARCRTEVIESGRR